MIRHFAYSFFVFLSLLFVGCTTPPVEKAAYGTTEFQVSGKAEAGSAFKKGLLMLHNFEYEDARGAFLEAQQLDPDMVMAYWGEALSHEHPLWGQKNLELSRAALAKLAPSATARVERARTEREKAYIGAVNELFAVDDDKQRAERYRDAMAGVSATYADDADAAALYALSILASSHDGRDNEKYMQAGAVTEQILTRFPNHPGALHYNLHSYDDPTNAARGLAAADRYAQVAPAAIHALHMPAHIYFALGMYEQASALNERSWEAAVARMQTRHVPPNGQAYHSLSWLAYSLVQEGRIEEAEQKLAIIHEHALREDNTVTRAAFILMRAQFVADTGRWDSDLLNLAVDYTGLPAYAVAADRYVRGVQAIHAGDLTNAEQLLAEFPAAGAEGNRNPRYAAAEISRLMLAAQLSKARGDTAGAFEFVQQAVEREHDMSPSNGPPIPVKPAAELLGDLYLSAGELNQAMDAYDKALTRRVGRRQSIEPRKQAAARLALAGLYNRAEPFTGITTAGQPDEAGLKAFADLGYTAVIDLRSDSEDRGMDEKAVVEELGLQYILLPVSGREGISFDNARQLDELLSKTKGPVLVHCGSSNRVGALFALRAKLAGASNDDALAIGKSAGLKSLEPVVIERLSEE